MFRIGVGLLAAVLGAVVLCGAGPREAEGFGCHGRAIRQRQVIRQRVVVQQEIVQPVVVQRIRVQPVVQQVYAQPVVVQRFQSCIRQPVVADCAGVPIIQQQSACQQFFSY